MELRILKRGMTGNDVHAAMVLMKDKGYYPYDVTGDRYLRPEDGAGPVRCEGKRPGR